MNCNNKLRENATYCHFCGNPINTIELQDKVYEKSKLNQLIALFCSIVLLISINLRLDIDIITSEIIFNFLCVILILIFSFLLKLKLLSLFKFQFNWRPTIFVITAPILLAFFIHYVVNYLCYTFDIKLLNYYQTFSNNNNQFLIATIFVSIFPAIIEEVIFRGILLKYLLLFNSTMVSVIISSILFAFVHFSFLTIIWHFLLGLILSYLFLKNKNLIYPIVFHLIYNLSILTLEALEI